MDSGGEQLSISDYGDDSESTCSLYSLDPTETYVEGDDDIISVQLLSEAEIRTALGTLSNYSYDEVEQLTTTTAQEDTEMDIVSVCSTAVELISPNSYEEARTALSEISLYSEYSPPPSETNVEIEYDIIADASPVSTAVDGNISWYTLPNSETEIEMNPALVIGGARVVDSLECIRQMEDDMFELRPVEDFGNPNIRLLCTGVSKTASDIEEEQYEYSYYSDGPSETNVSMDEFRELENEKDVVRQEVVSMPESEIVKSAAIES